LAEPGARARSALERWSGDQRRWGRRSFLEGFINRLPPPLYVVFTSFCVACSEPFIPIAGELACLGARQSTSGPLALCTDGVLVFTTPVSRMAG
jgi:hypothetical protein